MKPLFSTLILIFSCYLMTGCLSIQTNYSVGGDFRTLSSGESLTLDKDALERISASIETEAELSRSIELHKQFISENPHERIILDSLANQIILQAAAYTQSRTEKKKLFGEVMAICAESMRTQVGFRNRLDSGETLWEAVDALEAENMDAMLFWVTALLYTFKEGMVQPQQIINSPWIKRALVVLEHMESIDREWNGGAILFSKSLVYHAIPESIGGNQLLAKQLVDEANAISGDWMLSKWGRAKYFDSRNGDVEAMKSDLEAVILLNDVQGGEARYWRKYFVEDAKDLLSDLERKSD